MRWELESTRKKPNQPVIPQEMATAAIWIGDEVGSESDLKGLLELCKADHLSHVSGSGQKRGNFSARNPPPMRAGRWRNV